MDNPYEKIAQQWVYCVCCGSTEGHLEQHHVLYRSRGGKEEGNLVLLCPACHRKVHDERLRIEIQGESIIVIDRETNITEIKGLAPQIATGPSKLVDEARSILTWIQAMVFSDVLKGETDEHLAALYDELRSIKHSTWQCQAAIINEMQSRANYGDAATEHVAKALGCSQRTVQSRGQIFREIIAKPECAQAVELVREESFYRESVSAPDPVAAISLAAERKIENPGYTVAMFRAEMRTEGEESSLQRVVLYCERANGVDLRLAEGLKLRLGVPVELVFDEALAQVPARPAIRHAG